MQKPRDDTTEHIEEMIEEVRANIIISRELREASSNLRQQSAELREMLTEKRLTYLGPWR